MKTHKNTRDRIGEVFGKLTVIGRDWSRTSRVYWECLCECGQTSSAAACNLGGGKTQSCGHCVNVLANIAMYRVWASMRSRCVNPHHQAFRHYGGRGITVCERWRTFATFAADMGPCSPGLSLDRVDNNGPYAPDNCRWATKVDQANNKRTNRYITIGGRTQTMKQWTVERGLNYATVKSRINVAHWTPEEALQP